MPDIWLVAKHEISVMLRRRSFWIFTFLMPAILVAVNAYFIIQDQGLGSEDSGEGAPQEEVFLGLVDEANLIKTVPDDLPAELFVFYPDQTSARAALEAGDVEQYIVIPEEYVSSGKLTVYDRDFQLFQGGDATSIALGSGNEWMLDYLIDVNLLGDEQLAATLLNPLPASRVAEHVLRPEEEGEQDNEALAGLVASVTPYIYYFIIIIVAGYMMQSVTAEKENRTVEILLLSVTPRQLMFGKVFGLGLVALIQLAVWAGGGVLTLGRSSQWLDVSGYTFPPGFFLWATLFLILGYLLYASIMAAAGAIAPSAREAGQVTWLLILPLLPTLMFSSVFVNQPDGGVALALSLFPLSAPSAMVTRLAVADVPLWQLLLSLGGVALTAYAMVMLAGRFFQPQNLLSSASFSWRRLATAWRKR